MKGGTYVVCPKRNLILFSKHLLISFTHRLMVFEKRMPRRVFGPKRDEMIRGWRKLHNEELHNFYYFPYVNGMIRSGCMRWAGHVA
jgi:hypothetical protein